ncbi:MAG TPA: RNA polymerase sigma factor [Steroidobacteraceae bacterium]|nr:RNA polymerase sigma factor [Steroidobacteraceae bacterium]
MYHATSISGPPVADNDRIAAAIAVQGPRLRAFVKAQVADFSEAEDIVQDAFVELICAYRLMEPIEHVAAWLLRVARNRIIDRFRERSRYVQPTSALASPNDEAAVESDGAWADRIAPLEADPESRYLRALFADELLAALDELPAEQRDVFVAHELEGRSFKQLAAETGVGVSTLLGRKHAAVRHLRRRLQDIRLEFDPT